MKTKIYITTIFLILSIGLLNAQSKYYYYYKGKKVNLTLDKSSVNIKVSDRFLEAKYTDVTSKLQYDKYNNEKGVKYAVVNYTRKMSEQDYYNKSTDLKKITGVITVNPSFIGQNGIKIGMSDYLYIKLKKKSDIDLLQDVADKHNLTIVERNRYMPLWYTLRCTKSTIGNTMQVANSIFETGSFASSVPDLLTDDRLCTNDPDFGSLWGLENNNNPNFDINACDAWTLNQGNGVTVAVLDQGIELTHIDLAANISPLSYDTESNSSPSQLFGSHGTHCAGTIAAVKDNNIQVVGVAPKSTLMSVSNSLAGSANSRMKRADGINWAVANGADIISNSWRSGVQFDVIDDAIDNALQNGRNGKGAIIVFSAGNSYGSVNYPANSNPDILAVGSLTSSGVRSSFSCYGSDLDVIAPGSSILSTVLNNSTGYKSGTSMACPHAAGVAALIISINPQFTGAQVRNILESSCQKLPAYTYGLTLGRPNGTWNNETGYGLIDAYAAINTAVSMTPVDLYIKDSNTDIGIEPNTITTTPMWTSSDIWVRHNNDGGTQHQNPEYDATDPNYVYVKVKNRGNTRSTGAEKLKLYWAKAATSLSWPTNWDGSYSINNTPMGNIISIIDIPPLMPGQETIVKTSWLVPDPDDYSSINPEPWHFCLLARIVSANDPMHIAETISVCSNTKNNNNIAWKNISVVDVQPGSNVVNTTVAIGTHFGAAVPVNLSFESDESDKDSPIFENAIVTFKTDKVLQQVMGKGAKLSPEIVKKSDNTFVINKNRAQLNNLTFEPKTTGTMTISVKLKEGIVLKKKKYVWHLIQKDSKTGEIIGGETFVINVPKQDMLNPGIITEKDRQLSANNAIISVSPNPADNNIDIRYRVDNTQSAYIRIVGHSSRSVSNNYRLDTELNKMTINIGDYPNGFYSVMLICNGKIVDIETVIKK
ncbi:MAG: S8 family serine peptidase [Bacteroidales bacterium]|nr:S8 family serine peptidase [Bacteroidales bacterium]